VAGRQRWNFRDLTSHLIECGGSPAQDSRVFGSAKNALSLSFETRKALFFPHFLQNRRLAMGAAAAFSRTKWSSCMKATKVTTAVVGRHLGLTRQRVGQLADMGVIERLPNGEFDLDGSRLAYICWLRADDRRAAKMGSEDRVRDARAAEIEQRIAERNRRMVAEAQAETLKICDEFGGPLKSDLLAMPARLTGDLPLRRKMVDAIEAAFNEAAKRASAAADMVRKNG
jgi:hypothetical protein